MPAFKTLGGHYRIRVKDLVRVREKYTLEKWAFEIQRHGAAKDPKTTYSLLPEHQLTPEQQKEFQGLKLQDLEKLYSGEGSGDSLGSYDRKDDGVIDPAMFDSARVAAPGTRTIDTGFLKGLIEAATGDDE